MKNFDDDDDGDHNDDDDDDDEPAQWRQECCNMLHHHMSRLKTKAHGERAGAMERKQSAVEASSFRCQTIGLPFSEACSFTW